MKKIISTVLLGALVFNSISITALANGYDGISEVQENGSSIDISEVENADINNKYLEFMEQYKEECYLFVYNYAIMCRVRAKKSEKRGSEW